MFGHEGPPVAGGAAGRGGAGGPGMESENECGQQKNDVLGEAARHDHFNQLHGRQSRLSR